MYTQAPLSTIKCYILTPPLVLPKCHILRVYDTAPRVQPRLRLPVNIVLSPIDLKRRGPHNLHCRALSISKPSACAQPDARMCLGAVSMPQEARGICAWPCWALCQDYQVAPSAVSSRQPRSLVFAKGPCLCVLTSRRVCPPLKRGRQCTNAEAFVASGPASGSHRAWRTKPTVCGSTS